MGISEQSEVMQTVDNNQEQEMHIVESINDMVG